MSLQVKAHHRISNHSIRVPTFSRPQSHLPTTSTRNQRPHSGKLLLPLDFICIKFFYVTPLIATYLQDQQHRLNGVWTRLTRVATSPNHNQHQSRFLQPNLEARRPNAHRHQKPCGKTTQQVGEAAPAHSELQPFIPRRISCRTVSDHIQKSHRTKSKAITGKPPNPNSLFKLIRCALNQSRCRQTHYCQSSNFVKELREGRLQNCHKIVPEGEDIGVSTVDVVEKSMMEEIVKSGMSWLLGLEALFTGSLESKSNPLSFIPLVRKVHALSSIYVLGGDIFLLEETRAAVGVL